MEIGLRKVLTVNGKETIEFFIDDFYSSFPIGTSRSSKEIEILEFKNSVKKFLKIKNELIKSNFKDIYEVDEFLEKKIGRNNLSLVISSTFLKYFAFKENMKVYEYVAKILKTKPRKSKILCNVVGGGKHGGTNFQEFLIIEKDVFRAAKNYRKIGELIKKYDKNFNYQRNLESAWFTNLNYEKVIKIIKKVNKNFGIDFAASSSYINGKYNFGKNLIIKEEEQFDFISNLVRDYKIKYVEDPFKENDIENFKKFTKMFGKKIIVCGDDLYSSNIEYLKEKLTNAAIVKPSQIGLITKTIEFVKKLRELNMYVVFSHRSNETDDNIISHLAIGCNAEFVKFGAAGERIVKLNELIRICH